MSRTRHLVSSAVIAVALAAGLAAPALGQGAATRSPAVLVGLGEGQLPEVQSILIGLLLPIVKRGTITQAYDASFSGGVTVASGDVNGDGVADIITGSGPGGAPHVKVFDGRDGATLHDFFPYGPGVSAEVFVAAGDIDGDGRADVITGAGAGAPGGHVKVFSGGSGDEIRSFFAFPGFDGGARVGITVTSVNDRPIVDIVVGAGPGAGPHVKVFDGQTTAEKLSFFAFPSNFSGGVYVAGGSGADSDGDGIADSVLVVGAGPGGGPHVKVFDAVSGADRASFFAYSPVDFSGCVRVAAGDVNGDGISEIIVGAGFGVVRNGAPHVKTFDGRTLALQSSFHVYPASQNAGVFVSSHSVTNPRPPCDGDADHNGQVNFADIIKSLSNFNSPCD